MDGQSPASLRAGNAFLGGSSFWVSLVGVVLGLETEGSFVGREEKPLGHHPPSGQSNLRHTQFEAQIRRPLCKSQVGLCKRVLSGG